MFLGLDKFNARQNANNFTRENLGEVISYCHLFGVKVYVTLNVIIKQNELDEVLDEVDFIVNSFADAIIVQDFGLTQYISKKYPNFPIHISTQAGICNLEGAIFAKNMGASRIVLSRETELSEIKRISDNLDIEIEYFVQGALCVCFSGNCYMSSIASGNSGNRGLCKQPCRRKTSLKIGQTRIDGYNLSPKDLCFLSLTEKLISSGVSSFKIEGRMRSAEYVQTAVKSYREAISGGVKNQTLSNLKTTFNRGNFSNGYMLSRKDKIIYNKIQGNIGNLVGSVAFSNGKTAFVNSGYKPIVGDGFKIVRNFSEVGGGQFDNGCKIEKNGFSLNIQNLKKGDEVRLTFSKTLSNNAKEVENFKDISIYYILEVNKNAVISFNLDGVDYVYNSDIECSQAQKLNIEKAEVEKQLSKVKDFNLILKHIGGVIKGDVFLAKSQLNKLRRDGVNFLFNSLANKSYLVKNEDFSIPPNLKTQNRTAVILGEQNLSSFEKYDILVIKPQDYKRFNTSCLSTLEFNEIFLYLPNYFTNKDKEVFIQTYESFKFDGIYSDGYGGIELKKELGSKVFLGTNCNITNNLVDFIGDIDFYAYSKELNEKEILSINGRGFVLSEGNFDVMTFVHCPLINSNSCTCESCKFDCVSYIDEDGREFELNKIKMDGCLFFMQNNSKLNIGKKFNNVLSDFSFMNKSQTEKLSQSKWDSQNRGHINRGVN